MIPFDKREQAIADIERILTVLVKVTDPRLGNAISELREFKAHLELISDAPRMEIEHLLAQLDSILEMDPIIAAARRVVLEEDLVRITLQGLAHFEEVSRVRVLSDEERRKKAILETEIVSSKDRVTGELTLIAGGDQ